MESNQLSGNDIHIGKTIIKDSMSSLSILNYNQNDFFEKWHPNLKSRYIPTVLQNNHLQPIVSYFGHSSCVTQNIYF